MYSSEKVISENNIERTKQKIFKAAMNKFALNELDEATFNKISTLLKV